ncbi:MAG TPA: hypothetical protein PLW10_12390 [Myxococcota bacterium]|nr:hypothetical protein [Myxococcota bacterium]
MSERPKLGEILIEAGVIDELQLRSALGEQSRWGRRLGVTLVKLGMVEEGELVRALAQQLDLPVAQLSGKAIREDVLALVPARVAIEHSVVPLFTRGEGRARELFLGMEDPSNLDVLDDLSFRTGLEIRPVMVAPSELGEAIDRYYLGGRTEKRPAGPERAESTATVAPPAAHAAPAPQSAPTASAPSAPVALAPSAPTALVTTPAIALDASPTIDLDAPLPVGSEEQPSPGPDEVASAMEEPAPARSAARAVDAPALAREGSRPPRDPALVAELGRLQAELDRSRIALRALAQILIEKGVLTAAELQARAGRLGGGAAGG